MPGRALSVCGASGPAPAVRLVGAGLVVRCASQVNCPASLGDYDAGGVGGGPVGARLGITVVVLGGADVAGQRCQVPGRLGQERDWVGPQLGE